MYITKIAFKGLNERSKDIISLVKLKKINDIKKKNINYWQFLFQILYIFLYFLDQDSIKHGSHH